ncbi:MAG: DUF1444 family protein [Alphaproteobacteria bacterium]|nr:DUF1444 family protein [Alphaproteobacteria bacterium]
MKLDQFTTLLDQALAEQSLVITRPDPDDPLSGIVEPGTAVNLSHVYNACDEKSEVEARQQIDIFVASLKRATSDNPVAETWDEVRASVLPILRDRGSIHSSRLAPQASKGQDSYGIFPHLDIGADLIALAAVDTEDSIVMPDGDQFEDWGMTFEEVYEQALANLAVREPGPIEDLDDGLYGFFNGDDYESSRVLLPSFLDGLPSLDGDPVILCPSKDSLLLAGSKNAAALAEMAHQAANVIQAHRPLSGLAIVRRDGAWHPFPGPGDVDTDALRSLQQQWLSILYDEQKALLDEALEKQSRDIFVANYGIAPQIPDLAGKHSFSTWGEDIHVWLPEAEIVFFPQDDGNIYFAHWAAVRTVMGSRMTPLHNYPPRFEVESSPSEKDFAAMDARVLEQKKKPSLFQRFKSR